MRIQDDGIGSMVEVRGIVAAWLIYLTMLLGAIVFSIGDLIPIDRLEPVISGETASITGRPDSELILSSGGSVRNFSASETLE